MSLDAVSEGLAIVANVLTVAIVMHAYFTGTQLWDVQLYSALFVTSGGLLSVWSRLITIRLQLERLERKRT